MTSKIFSILVALCIVIPCHSDLRSKRAPVHLAPTFVSEKHTVAQWMDKTPAGPPVEADLATQTVAQRLDGWGKHHVRLADKVPVDVRKGPSKDFLMGLAVATVFVPVLLGLCACSKLLVVFSCYVGLYVSWALLTYATRDVLESSAMLVLNVLVIKLCVSLILWRAWEGDSYLQLPAAMWKERGTLYMYCVPAGLYAVGDMLSVDALRATDPSTFAVLRNTRMLFLIFVWQYFMNRKLEAIHWISLLAIMMGCVAKEVPNIGEGNQETRYWAYGMILILGVVFSTAAVWNEKLLQGRPDVGVSLQNLAMYTWGILWLLPVSLCMYYFMGRMGVNPMEISAWTFVWQNPMILLLAFTMAFHGICAAYFLRYLSSIAREVALGVYTILSIVMDITLFHGHLVPLEYVGIALVMLGVSLFAYRPVVAKLPDDATGEDKAQATQEPQEQPGSGAKGP